MFLTLTSPLPLVFIFIFTPHSIHLCLSWSTPTSVSSHHCNDCICQSLRGTTPDEESSFIDMINCSRKTTCEYDYRTCQILDEQCQGVCVWVGTKQDGYCTGGSSRSCKSILDIDSCHNDGCVWSNNACRNPSFTCSDYNGSGKCVRKGCAWDWNDGVCRTSPSIFNCSKYDGTSSKNCMSKGCVWDGNTRTCNANTNVDATLLRT